MRYFLLPTYIMIFQLEQICIFTYKIEWNVRAVSFTFFGLQKLKKKDEKFLKNCCNMKFCYTFKFIFVKSLNIQPSTFYVIIKLLSSRNLLLIPLLNVQVQMLDIYVSGLHRYLRIMQIEMIIIQTSIPFVQYFKYEMNAQILGTVRENAHWMSLNHKLEGLDSAPNTKLESQSLTLHLHCCEQMQIRDGSSSASTLD